MDNNNDQFEKAQNPEDLPKFFLARANAGDAAGIAELYEPNAVLVIDKNWKTAVGRESIRNFYEQLLKNNPKFESGIQRPALKNGNLALTSSKLVDGTVTVEVARLQADNTWLWAIDQPAIATEKE